MLKNILMGTMLAILVAPTVAVARDDSAKSERRFAKKFREVTQVVQYDGDYSPSATREPEQEAAPGVPVRFLPAWKRDIPVRVKPAPRYVDPAPAKTMDRQQGAVPTQSFQQLPDNGIITSNSSGAGNPAENAQGYIPGAGSATGSTTYANYGTGLPGSGEAQGGASGGQ
jgi:hypothetical protein